MKSFDNLYALSISHKRRRENQTPNFVFNKYFPKMAMVMRYFGKKYGTIRQATDVDTARCMRCACWITKAIHTDSNYLILIAFTRQEWLHESDTPGTMRVFFNYIPKLLLYYKNRQLLPDTH